MQAMTNTAHSLAAMNLYHRLHGGTQQEAAMIDKPNLEKMELIQRYQQIQADLEASVANGRPICQALAGDLMALAGSLGCNESTQTWLRELQEQAASKTKSPGAFSGVSDAFT